jgi:HEAT repeat protein
MEASEGKTIKEPRWYNEGFAWLKKGQQDNGSWHDTDGLDAVNTAFGVLFLLRSTKKAIERSKSFGESALAAGRGLPDDPATVRLRGTQVVSKKSDLSPKELIEVLSQPEHPSFGAALADVEYLSEQLAPMEAAARSELLTKLRAVVNTGVADARLSAVQVLGRVRDLDSGPALVAALDDADWRVVLAADESLRNIGRSLKSSGLGEKPDAKARAAAIQRWKQWYVAIRPDAQFEN